VDTAIKVTVRKAATELTWYTAGVSIGCEGSVSQRGYDGGDDQPRYLHNDYLAMDSSTWGRARSMSVSNLCHRVSCSVRGGGVRFAANLAT
jgi:hypothetical protein